MESFLDSDGLGRVVRKLRAKETLFAQGDPANHVIYVQEGGVRLTVVNESGKEVSAHSCHINGVISTDGLARVS